MVKSTNMQKMYEDLDKSYDQIAAAFSATRTHPWADLAFFEPYVSAGMNVIDIGCGNGRLAPWILEKGAQYRGVDRSGGLIAQAKLALPEVSFEVMDALNLTVPDQSFDAAISVAVLNHFPTRELQQQFLHEAYRVLKSGGVLLLSNWNLWNISSKKGLGAFARDKDTMAEEDFMKKYGVPKQTLADRDVITVWDNKTRLYYYAFDTRELTSLAKSVGFTVEKNVYVREGKETEQGKGTNIITIARKSQISNSKSQK